MGNKITVLMTGAGAPGGPGIIKALLSDPNIDLYTADMNEYASGRFLVSDCRFSTIPNAKDEKFIQRILELCNKHKVDVLFPLVTLELFKISQYKNEFLNRNIRVIVSEYDAINIANNKCQLYSHLKANDIAIPNFKIINKNEYLEQAAYELGYPDVPVVMKPCISNGSRGIRILDTKKDRFSLLFDEKPTSLYTNLNEIMDTIKGKKIPPLMLCEYLPGDEITVDTLVKEGEMKECLLRKRNTMNNGISTSGTFIDSDSIDKYIEQIIRAVPGLEGPVGFQVKQSKDGEFLLLESNPRIQGTSVAALGVGINLPQLAVYLSVDSPSPSLKINRKKGISFSRYFSEVFYES